MDSKTPSRLLWPTRIRQGEKKNEGTMSRRINIYKQSADVIFPFLFLLSRKERERERELIEPRWNKGEVGVSVMCYPSRETIC